MYKFWISIKKEFLLLLSDKAGLAMMFVMPILMVYIITIVQDSALKIVNENKISLLLVNSDTGASSKQLAASLQNSHFFALSENNSLSEDEITNYMLENDQLTALYIPPHFSAYMEGKTSLLTSMLLTEAGLGETNNIKIKNSPLLFFHDPVLQENYCSSIMNLIHALAKKEESALIIADICKSLDVSNSSSKLEKVALENELRIEKRLASLSDKNVTPNSSQHNVPAWSIFAMFFMVISLGGNIVKEKLNGSFIRLKTMPTNFLTVLRAKTVVYILAVFLQVFVVFSLTKYTFPFINLPVLEMPDNFLAFIVVVLGSGITAISFAMAIGMLAHTQEQANGFGAVIVVILAALGGIWVPIFVMPHYLQVICNLSPLSWCLQAFYVLFLKDGSWTDLLPYLGSMMVFSLSCFALVYFQLRKMKLI